MKQSKLFGKTQKESPSGAHMISHDLLYRAGYIRESVAGRYYFLPLGMRVQDNIMAIVAEEMNRTGAQKMLTPTLHQLDLWKETKRTETTGFELMVLKDQREMEFALGGTAEEMITDVVRRFTHSYRDLPFNIYQFSNKFRDEKRARGGLLRTREFIMKDAYSFHANESDFRREYDVMGRTYTQIFERMGLQTDIVEADNGYIGGEYCHEFQVEHPQGEGRYLVTENSGYSAHEDVAYVQYSPINESEEVKEMETIEQPEWVKTMEDNIKHYEKESAAYFLKNVVYRHISGDIIIVTLRGDLEANKTKLEQLLDSVGQIEDATDEDLAAIGTQSGYVHSWGHSFAEKIMTEKGDREARVIYVADESLKTVKNFIGGHKSETQDTINVNYGRDFTHEVEGDVAMAQAGMMAPDGSGEELIEKRGIEVGNIFQLGHHYSSLMNANYMSKEGKPEPYYMGCYGIGIGRTMATIVEKYHDEKGIIWPEEVAPFKVHLITFGKEESMFEQAEAVYKQMLERGMNVLFDDRRGVAPGEKFADADLLGMPYRVVMSSRSLEKGGVEIKRRNSEEAEVVTIDELFDRFHS